MVDDLVWIMLVVLAVEGDCAKSLEYFHVERYYAGIYALDVGDGLLVWSEGPSF